MDIDIRTLLGKLNPECKHAMSQAAELCVRQTHFHVDIEHLFVTLIETQSLDMLQVLSAFGVDSAIVLGQLRQSLERFKRGNGRTPAMSPHFVPLFQESWMLSSMLLGEQQIRSGTLVLALLEVDSLRGLLLETAPSLLQIPRESLRGQLAALLAHSGDRLEVAGVAQTPQAAVNVQKLAPRRSDPATPALDQYTVDITAQARQGAFDPILGRDEEIRQIVDILLRRRQNNPILTGEAGVGKTAVVEGFAQRVVRGEVPPALRGVSVRSLDLALLQAGAGIKGEFENRLKSVIAEVKASAKPVILFIDEAHQLIGAGGAEGQGDAANLLKPALARGELRTIAATTWAEYKKYVERDPALARRFQVVKVDEPEPEVAIEMLRGMVATLQKHHGIEILDDAVCDAVKLSHRYISGRQLPDKAISVLDTACARVAVNQSGEPEALEFLQRAIASAQSRIRVLRNELAMGVERRDALNRIELELVQLQTRHVQLSGKLALEKKAVMEIVELRRCILNGTARPPHNDNEDSDPNWATHELTRLMKGLEALQADEPLVPVCVDSGAVAEVISSWTGIPVGKMLADELHTVLHLKDRLAERVVGQDNALDVIARRVRTSRADLDDPSKPVGVFMLVGPSGVGKTETAFALADLLYGGERNMIIVNMSEFQEAHSVSSLKGAPPGYVGYGRGGVLTEAVRRRPYSVVLLDEMEKAHPDVLELFFQVFDKGVMEDGEGVQINFRNTLILLTSNAAQDIITDACLNRRWPDSDELVEQLRPALLKQFSPAFLGRLVLVPYYPLGDKQIHGIVRLKLNRLAQRVKQNHHAYFRWNDAVVHLITERCTEVDSGARNVDFILTQSVLPELSSLVLEHIAMDNSFSLIEMSVDVYGNFAYKFKFDTREFVG